MHQFGWLSERGGNFLNLLQKIGVTQKGGDSLRKGGSNAGGNYVVWYEHICPSTFILSMSLKALMCFDGKKRKYSNSGRAIP